MTRILVVEAALVQESTRVKRCDAIGTPAPATIVIPIQASLAVGCNRMVVLSNLKLTKNLRIARMYPVTLTTKNRHLRQNSSHGGETKRKSLLDRLKKSGTT